MNWIKLMLLTALLALFTSLTGTRGGGGMEPQQDFTHTVIGELFSQTTCSHCPYAEEALKQIYYEDGYEFYFLIYEINVNDEANSYRSDRYPQITGTPTTEFDGGYRERRGSSDDVEEDRQAMREDIEESGQRDDTPVSLKIEMHKIDGDSLKVKVQIRWDEDGTVGNPTLQVDLYVAIVEETSTRYRNTNGKYIPFGFLSFAVDESLELDPHEWTTVEATWNGSDHSDDYGDMSNVDYDNLAAIAFVFDDDPSTDPENPNQWALQSEGAIPPVLNITRPEHASIVSGTVTIEARTEANETQSRSISRVEYRVDDSDWNPMSQVSGSLYRADWDTTGVDNGNHTVYVRSTDNTNTSIFFAINVTVQNDDKEPPSVEIITPEEDEVVNGTVIIEVDATDNNVVESVYFRIDGGQWKTMREEDDRWTAIWNTTQYAEGSHCITVRASDGVNEAMDQVNVTVDNDASPSVEIVSPDDGSVVSGTVQVMARVRDDGSIENVVFCIDGRSQANMTLSGDLYLAEWNTTEVQDGGHTISVFATDDVDQTGSDSISVYVDNEEEDSPPSVEIRSPLSGVLVSGIMEITVVATDDVNVTDVLYVLDEGEWKEMDRGEGNRWHADADTSDLMDGDHILKVRAVDSANQTSENQTRFRSDNNPPEIISISPDGYVKETFTLTVHVTDYSDVNTSIRVDGETWRKMTMKGGTFQIEIDSTQYEDGNHSIEVRAVDEVQLESAEKHSLFFDNTPPAVEILQPESESEVSDVVRIEADCTDNAGIEEVAFSVDHDENWIPMIRDGVHYRTDWDTTSVDNGKHVISVRAFDLTGHETVRSVYVTVENDLDAPKISDVEISPAKPTTNDDVTISAKVTDDDGVRSVRIEYVTSDSKGEGDMAGNGDIYTYTWPAGSLPEGDVTFNLTAEDTEGNVARHSGSFTVVLTSDNPQLVVTFEPSKPRFFDRIVMTAHVTDPDGIADVQLTITGEMGALPYTTTSTSSPYHFEFVPGPTSWVRYSLMAVDDLGNENWANGTISIDLSDPEYIILMDPDPPISGALVKVTLVLEESVPVDYVEMRYQVNETSASVIMENIGETYVAEFDLPSGLRMEMEIVIHTTTGQQIVLHEVKVLASTEPSAVEVVPGFELSLLLAASALTIFALRRRNNG